MTQPREDGWHPDRQGGGGKVCPQSQQPCSPSSKNAWDSAGKCPHADSGITAYYPGNPEQSLSTGASVFPSVKWKH